MARQMIAVGEQTGAIDAMLSKIAAFYEEDFAAAVKVLLRVLDPSTIPFLGLVVAASGSSFFVRLIICWLTLGILGLILLRWLPQARGHGGLQVAGDVAMISLLVYSTGLQESYFISLYLLVIIVASILFSRRVAFLTTAVCFLFLAGMTMLAFSERIPRTFSSLPTAEHLRIWLVMNLLGFLAVAYLASLLAQSLRKQGVDLEEKRAELLILQDFTDAIIHSMS